MGLRGILRRLKLEARQDLPSFELLDGSRYYYAPSTELYLFCYDTIGKNPDAWPAPPEVLRKLCEAKEPAVAFAVIMGGDPRTDDYIYSDIFPFSPEIIIRERRLEPRSLVAGRDPYDRELDDLSE